jgi:cobalt transporter subunit CbtB
MVMEKVFQDARVARALVPALILVGAAVAMVVVFYGVDSIAAGAHDAFHDFRHTIGMPCH